MKIKRFNKKMPLPHYATERSIGLDLSLRETVTIPAGGTMRVPLNVAIEYPQGYWGLLAARSSLHKRGLIPANGVGIIDPDYCGDNDEYQYPLYNFTAEPVTLEAGERIAQLILLPVFQPELVEVDKMSGPDRGGFGSTGR